MSIKDKINIAVIGATGYTGLTRVLVIKTPKDKIKNLCATKNIGKNKFFDKRIKKKLPKITPVSKVDWHVRFSFIFTK